MFLEKGILTMSKNYISYRFVKFDWWWWTLNPKG